MDEFTAMDINSTDYYLNGSDILECEADRAMEDHEKLLRFVLHGVLLNAVGAAGLAGNALAIIVLSRPQMRSSVNYLLIGLAAADTVLIITSVLLFGLTAIYPYTGHLRQYYYHICPRLTKIAFPLALVAQTMSVYLTLIVTLERWVAVCHPFRARALCTSSRARWYVIGTLIFSLAYNTPKFFEAEMERVDGVDGDYIYCIRATEFRTPLYVTIYIHWMYLIVMYIVPFTALAVLNTCIVRQVRRAKAERARLSRVQRREIGLATMLMVVVVVFFLCNLLPLVTNSFEVFQGEEFEKLDVLVKTSNLLVMLNSSVNFLIYVIFGEKFKRVFLMMFCVNKAWSRGKDSPEHTRDDSYGSIGERYSNKLLRNGTYRRSDTGMGSISRGRGARGRSVYYPSGVELTTFTTASIERTPSERMEPPPTAARWNGQTRNGNF